MAIQTPQHRLYGADRLTRWIPTLSAIIMAAVGGVGLGRAVAMIA